MIEVPEAEKIAWQSGTQKNLRIVFDDGMTIENDDIFSESMTLEQTLSDEQNIKYGKCSSACFTVKIADTSVSLKGKKFTAVLKCGEYSRNLGIFTVFTDNRTDDRKYKEIVAYDAIYKLSTIDCTAWYKGLTFPMTLKSFRDSFFSRVGITQETKVLPNDSLQIEKTIDPSSISGLAIAESICELNARFGQIGFDGKFRYVSIGNNLDALYPRNDLFPAEDLYPRDNVNFTLTTDDYSQGSLVYEDYTTQKVTKVVVREQEGDVGGSAGTGENIYYITGNFLAYGQNQENLSSIASNIYNEIENVSYHPSRVTTMSYLPFAEVGDLVRVIGVTDTIIFPVLKRSITGITGAKETYSASGTETMSENSSTIADEIIQLKGRSNVLKRTIDETQSTITRLEENVDGEVERLQTQITQNTTDITLEATRATGAENTLSGRITVNASNITAEVTRATGAESTLSGRITVNADNITSEVTRATGAENTLSGRITVNAENISSEVTRATGAEGTLSSRISQSAHEISLSVSGSVGQNSSAGITISLLDENGNQIDSGSGNIMLDGTVVFKNNLTDGTTQISGNNITTGKINAQYINTSGLIAEDISATTILGKTLIGSSLTTNPTPGGDRAVIEDGSVKITNESGNTLVDMSSGTLTFSYYLGGIAGFMFARGGSSGNTGEEYVQCGGTFNFGDLRENNVKLSDKYLLISGGSTTGNITTPANDNYGIVPATNNYGQIGSSDYHYFRSYINNMYTNGITISRGETRATSAGKIYSYLNGVAANKYMGMIQVDGNAVSIKNGERKDIVSSSDMNLTPGIYIIHCTAYFSSTSVEGACYIELATSSGGSYVNKYAQGYAHAPSGGTARVNLTTIIHVSGTTRYYLTARHTRTNEISVTGGFKALRLGNA